MSGNHTILQSGANTRAAALSVLVNHGPAVFVNFCNRSIWELANVLGEIQDAEFATETLYRVGDEILAKRQPAEVRLMERKDQPPAEPPSAPAPSWLRSLIWLGERWWLLLALFLAYALGALSIGSAQ